MENIDTSLEKGILLAEKLINILIGENYQTAWRASEICLLKTCKSILSNEPSKEKRSEIIGFIIKDIKNNLHKINDDLENKEIK